MYLLNIEEDTFNYKKLKEIRVKKDFSLAEVAEKLEISEATLSRYENGLTKKISLETIKKISLFYGVDYTYFYGLPTLPLTRTITGAIISMMYGISLTNIYNGISTGSILNILGYKKIKKYFEKIKNKNPKESLFAQLTEEEKEEYEAFRSITYSFLKTKQIFSQDEMENDEAFLFSYYFAHKIKREAKIIGVEFNKK